MRVIMRGPSVWWSVTRAPCTSGASIRREREGKPVSSGLKSIEAVHTKQRYM